MSLLFSPDGPRLTLADFRLLRDLVNRYCGIDLGGEMRPILERRLAGRLEALALGSFGEYYRFLRYNPERESELERAVEIISTNETYFFRELPQLTAFRDEVLPEIRRNAPTRGRLSVWSAGCSTGEEAYSIAILIDQSGLFRDREVQVFGNDICRRVLHTAREGRYRDRSFRAMPDRYWRYFGRDPEGYSVVGPIRSLCHFGHFNLLDEASAAAVGRVDAIFCRNVLIYLDHAARRRLVASFYRRLLPGGFLMLGHSESLINDSTAFEIVQLSGDLVYRKPVGADRYPAALELEK